MCIFFWILHVSSYHMIFIFLWLTSLCVIISRTTYVDVHRQMNGKRRWGIHTHTHNGILFVLSHFSHVQLFSTPWTIASWSPLSMGFSRQEY